jgi:adenylosuccinate lyase
MQNVVRGMVVHEKQVAKHLAEELPFMATEAVIMAAVEQGGDRQAIHEVIRVHSREASLAVNHEGKPNDLLDRLKADPAFAKIDIDSLVNPLAFIGRSPEQVDDFLAQVIEPIRARYGDQDSPAVQINV